MLGVSWDAVGQTSLEICPDKLVRVEFRRISREVKGVDSRIAFKESLDELGLVDGASVPEENDRAFEAAAKMPEEVSDLSGPDVLIGIKARVESKSFSSWRDRDGGDSRYLGPASGDNEDGCFSFNRPGSLDIGNKRESALIQEGQAGSKPSGLFLYAAKRDISSSGSSLRVFPWLFWSVSDSSNPSRSSNSRDSRCSSAPESVSELPVRYASRSKDPSSNRPPEALSLRRAPRISSVCPTKDKVVPYLASTSVLCGPSSCSSDANAPRSLKRRPVPGPPSDTYGLVSTSGRPNDAASLVFGVCHGVS